MYASYGQKGLMALLGVCLIFVLSPGAFATDQNDSVVPLIVQEPAISAQTVSFRYDNMAVAQEKTPPAADETAAPCETNCCPTCVAGGGYVYDPHWFASVEAVWLSPQANNQEIIFDQLYAAGSSKVSGLFITPRIGLGYQGERWGVQARYWRMNEGGYNIDDDIASWLKAETFDIEGTRILNWRDTRNQISFGLRYGELNQVVTFDAAGSRTHLSGVGPTVALTGLKPIGSENLNLFYNFRGSVIWDNDAMNYAYVGAVTDLNSEYGYLFIGEVQVGVQWNFELMYNYADAFLRFALEYQYWSANDMSPATVTSGVTTVITNNARADLIGFSIGTGFTW